MTTPTPMEIETTSPSPAPLPLHNDANKTSSVAILVGKPDPTGQTVPVVVWVDQTRSARSSPEDPWKHTLTYYEFLDDATRWTHLDALLFRLVPLEAVHVASSETTPSHKKKEGTPSVSSSKQQKRLQQVVSSLKGFLEERFQEPNRSTSLLPDDDDEEDLSVVACHWHDLVSPMDAAKRDAAMERLLLQDSNVQLAYRGNLSLHATSTTLLTQGLALWWQSHNVNGSSQRNNMMMLDHDEDYHHACQLEAGVLTSHLVMDRTAASCIHLLPPANAGVATVVGGTSHTNSLYGVLSKPCLTNMGKQTLQVWLRQPLIDKDAILTRQNAITELLGLAKDAIRDALQTFAGVDLAQLAQTLGLYNNKSNNGDDAVSPTTSLVGGSRKALHALYQLYLLASSKLPQLLEAVTSSLPSTSSGLLQQSKRQIQELVSELDRCQGLAEAVLDLDHAPRDYLVKPTFSSELGELGHELAMVQQGVDDELQAMQDLWNAQAGGDSRPVKLERMNDESAWQFRLADTNAGKVLQSSTMSSSLQIKVHRLLKNGVYFSTVRLRQLSAKYQELHADYDQQSQQIVRDAMNVATTYQTVVERAATNVATLDVLCSLAYVAAYSPHGYCKPIITDSDDDGAGIHLTAARHPCVELQDDMEFIPNDVKLLFGDSNFMLVTGPNMGGKSTYIRALGAIVCLAQIGSYVPCSSATINICHSILARVGAGDLQERGISTFMAEMLEASSILRTATKRSLIIIDELGRGTSTFDGYGLARAISEYVMDKIGCMTVFATHFHELTQLEQKHKMVQNCHVTAQKGNQGLTFLYEVRPGPCLESFGIQVAEMAHVPQCVIEDAKRKAKALECFGSSNNKNDDGATQKALAGFQAFDVPALLDDPTLSDEQKRAQLQQLLA